jgi:hypothetical protein
MGVQQNHYLLIGAKFGHKQFYSLMEDPEYFRREVENKYIDNAFKGISHHNDLCIISDGMDGEYVYIGHVMQKSGNYGSMGDYVNSRPTPTPETVREWIKKEFNIDAECDTHCFTHYR